MNGNVLIVALLEKSDRCSTSIRLKPGLIFLTTNFNNITTILSTVKNSNNKY